MYVCKTVVAMGAAILPNLLRFSMLRKPDVTSVVSKTLAVFFNTYQNLTGRGC